MAKKTRQYDLKTKEECEKEGCAYDLPTVTVNKEDVDDAKKFISAPIKDEEGNNISIILHGQLKTQSIMKTESKFGTDYQIGIELEDEISTYLQGVLTTVSEAFTDTAPKSLFFKDVLYIKIKTEYKNPDKFKPQIIPSSTPKKISNKICKGKNVDIVCGLNAFVTDKEDGSKSCGLWFDIASITFEV